VPFRALAKAPRVLVAPGTPQRAFPTNPFRMIERSASVKLTDAEELARRLMKRHGLAAWEFGFNRRKRSLGLCRYTEQRIELSTHFVAGHDEPSIRDVILHEIAHALAGHEAAHGPLWRTICAAIGAKPERCGNANMPSGRWQATCPGCSHQYDRIRRPPRRQRYICPRCGPQKGKLHFRAG
jgi:predicted SprT family Zn-dependent metalloprotease